jgi:Ca2+-binding RTX toxin-like protein
MDTAAGGEEEAGVTETIRTVEGDYTGGVETPGVEAPSFVLDDLGETAAAPAPAVETTETIVEELAPVAEPVAQAPALVVTAVATAEDQPFALNIEASLADTDGSESLEITVAGVPQGAVLSAGADNGDGTWTLSADQLEGLTLTPPPGSGADFELTVTATATEASGDTASTAAALAVSLAAMAEAPEVAVSAAATAEDIPVGLEIEAGLAGAAGDEEISAVTISGVPEGAVLSAGTDNGDGSWTLAADDLEGLTITPPAGSGADFALQVSAATVQTDPDTGEQTTATAGPVALAVSVAAVADQPTLEVSDVTVGGGGGEPGDQVLSGTGGADTLIGGGGDDVLKGKGGDDVLYGDGVAVGRATVPIDVMATLADSDYSESMMVTIAGVPEGAELSAGADGGDGTWALTSEELEGLTMTLPEGFDEDFQMQVTATATDIDVDTGAADTAAVSAVIDVTFAEGGEAGDDVLKGGGGDDVLYGGGGDDELKGEGGDDILHGGAGEDVLKGEGGDDILHGGGGEDELKGGGGADVLMGGAGDDELEGGGGADVLMGGAGDDELEGGGGDDRFVFEHGAGSDTVSDFKKGDALQFKGDEFSLEDLSIEQVGDHAVISFEGRDLEVTLNDTDAASLQGYQITPADGDLSGVTIDFLE